MGADRGSPAAWRSWGSPGRRLSGDQRRRAHAADRRAWRGRPEEYGPYTTIYNRFNLPNGTDGQGWFFKPFAWQLLFTIGIVAGLAALEGIALPRSSQLLRLALVVVANANLIAVLVPASARWLSATPAAVIAVLGRRSLPVFALGTVLSVAGTIALTEAS